MLTDIVELMPTDEQYKALEALKRSWDKQERLQGLYAWVAAQDFRGHLVPRDSQRPSSMDELLDDKLSSHISVEATENSSELRLADHCALLLTPYTVIPPSVQQCLIEHIGNEENTVLITTPSGWLVECKSL